ncbi:hypothetical protein PVK06_020771 [Gossypium arboreum]|uniref:Transcription factor VOZ1-like n=1 Tax=Gossypium arboreum TaxID=29729 RepID=A0ABR0PNQ9_GOSAR|nr:hypothetical protein PVK06_020771 [Gossypium arboreum]
MGKGSKNNCKSASHKLFKDKAKNRVDDLQGMFLDLQFARKESRGIDVAVLEEQLHQMLREWKAELNEPSPASSLQQLCEEEDDATSILVVPKPEPNDQSPQVGDIAASQERYAVNQGQHECGFPLVDQCKESPSQVCTMSINSLEGAI